MSRIKYSYYENTKTGTHSFYAKPVFAGTLTMDEILEEALDGKSIEPSVARAAITEFKKAVKRNVLKGYRCNLGDDFLTIYPNLQLSVKDYEDEQTHQLVVANADMLSARNAKSRIGCTVSPKFSTEFATSVQWQKTDKNGSVIEEDDATQGNENVEGNQGGTTPTTNGENSEP